MVEADGATAQSVCEALRREGYLVESAATGDEALQKAHRGPFDVALIDIELHAMRGFGLLHKLESVRPDLVILVCASQEQTSRALEAIKQGAYDILTKPIKTPNLLIRVKRALERRQLNDLVEVLEQRAHGRDRLGSLLGSSLAMQLAYQGIQQVAPTESLVLIQGETGVGKEVAAREIHRLSRRKAMPFVVVAARDLPPKVSPEVVSLLTLLGVGPGGTVLLAEVEQLTLETQGALLRLLRESDGRQKPTEADPPEGVRLISTATIDLDEAMEKGEFLPDLYYQLSEFLITLPPLRERIEDLQMVIRSLMESECSRTNKPLRRCSPRGLELLTRYDWPGNVKELQGVIEDVVAHSKYAVIGPRDLVSWQGVLLPTSRPQTLEEVERNYISNVLKQVSGNKRRAAELLGIARSSFYRKVKKL